MICDNLRIVSVSDYKEKYKAEENKIMFFDSGDIYINNELYYSSNNNCESRLGTFHLLIDNNTIIGYAALRNTSLVLNQQIDINGNNINKGSPALEIYSLGIDNKFQKYGYGTTLIKYVIGLAQTIDKELSKIDYIVLYSTQSTVDFYKRIGFDELKKDKGEILKEASTGDCVPMYLKLP